MPGWVLLLAEHWVSCISIRGCWGLSTPCHGAGVPYSSLIVLGTQSLCQCLGLSPPLQNLGTKSPYMWVLGAQSIPL